MGPMRRNPIQRTVRAVRVCVCVHRSVHNCWTQYCTEQTSYPPDSHHCSDDVYLREGGGRGILSLAPLVSLSVNTVTHKVRVERTGNEDSICIAPLSTHAYSQSAQTWITQFYLQTTPCLPFLRKRSPDGATTMRQQTSSCNLLLIYRPRKDERLSWPGWLTYSGWFTHRSGHPSAGRAQYRTRKVRRPKTDVATVVLFHIGTRLQVRFSNILSFHLIRIYCVTAGTVQGMLHFGNEIQRPAPAVV